MDTQLQPDSGEGAVLRRIWAQLSPRRKQQLFLVLAAMLAGAFAEVLSLGTLVPFLAVMASPEKVEKILFVMPLANAFGLSMHGSLLTALTLAFATAALLSALFRIGLSWVSNRYVFMLGHDLGVRLYERVLYQPYQWQVQRNSSETVADVGRVQLITTGMIMPLMQAASSTIIGVFIIGTLLLVNPAVTLISFTTFGFLYFLVSRFTRKNLRVNGRIVSRAQRERVQAVMEGVGGIRDVLLDGSQRVFLKRFSRVDQALRDAQSRNSLAGTTPRLMIEALGMILIACLALYLTQGPGGFTASLPALGALALGSQRLMPLMQTGYSGWTRVVVNGPALEDVLAVLERPLPPKLKDSGPPLPFDRAIAFREVSFRYNAELAPVLDKVTFEIAKGSRVGLVGKTGSGKSTLADLLMALLDPTGGQIAIDDRVLDEGSRRAWQRQIAHVPQAIFLADASIAENIAFGVDPKNVDMELVKDAARHAELADFIETLPKGYDTVVGERGIRLSGGQRQRVGIARALFKKATVLVFDEATSALDNATEAAVMHSIDQLARDLTIIIIAHRLTTVANCDMILSVGKSGVAVARSLAELGEMDLGPEPEARPLVEAGLGDHPPGRRRYRGRSRL